MPFRAGMNARAEIKTKRRESVLSVPVGAVVSRPKGSDDVNADKKEEKSDEFSTEENNGTEELEEVVYVLKQDGTVEKRTVSTGIQDMAFFEITSGLKEEERVVTGPYNAVSKTLQSGKKVRVVAREKIFQND
jgi:HlyD family secretion protein